MQIIAITNVVTKIIVPYILQFFVGFSYVIFQTRKKGFSKCKISIIFITMVMKIRALLLSENEYIDKKKISYHWNKHYILVLLII